ncbi:hypothetical protein [Coleofasciculus sp. FACHB-1120]|uniref:hypothetical protein n=1 Tax=Coleofasciculus sp. FACHB-1120 TaxID=2692783 RepID=UPI00168A1D77|nr:hypothetical protein [Coleofasciculus sp. FACHB-1120]MBD2743234.1 hypothetical protein [Coleofasciculus sp. FACHB-1120]
MSGKFKSLLVLVGMALGLSACSVGESTQSTPIPASSPSVEQSSQQVSQNALKNTPVAGTERTKYKPIQLQEIKSANSLKGTDPKAIAIAHFGQTESEGGTREVTLEYPQQNLAVVTITQTGVADDSVGAIRHRVELVPTSPSAQTAKEWKLAWAGSQVKCHVGRGHQDWSTQNCQ